MTIITGILHGKGSWMVEWLKSTPTEWIFNGSPAPITYQLLPGWFSGSMDPVEEEKDWMIQTNQ